MNLNMFAAMLLSSLAFLAVLVSAIPVGSVQPSIVTKLAIFTSVPSDISPSMTTPHLVARSQDWAIPQTIPKAPVYYTPASSWTLPVQQTYVASPHQSWPAAPVQTVVVTATPTPMPTPTYTWKETHNDFKNTKINGITFGIIFGCIFGALALFVMLPCMAWHKIIKPWSRKRQPGKDVEASFSLGEGMQGPSGFHTIVQNDRAPQRPAATHQLRAHVARDADGFLRVVLPQNETGAVQRRDDSYPL
jgi:hypothetical protein